MAKINVQQIRAAYDEGKKVVENSKPIQSAVSDLHTIHGMNAVSAQHYIKAYVAMRNGTQYNRTINGNATEYFLENIRLDLGVVDLCTALKSVQLHINYQSSLKHNSLKNIKKIYNNYLKYCPQKGFPQEEI